MQVGLWCAKGGAGTSVTAASLALVTSRSSGAGVLLVDAGGGDLPAVLGMADPTGPGLTDWLAAGPETPSDSLGRLEVDVCPALRLLPWGAGLGWSADRSELLAAVLGSDPRDVVVDVGLVGELTGSAPAGVLRHALALSLTESLLVTRPCYLALRRGAAVGLRPSGVVLVDEPARALGPADVEAVLGAPLRAVVDLDPAVARAVDAGLLVGRLPRSLGRAMEMVA